MNEQLTDLIERLIREYGKDIYSFCVYLTGSRDQADDLYQQTFLTAMEKEDIREEDNPKSYLLSIAANLSNNRRRKLFRHNDVSIEDEGVNEVADPSGSVEDDVIAKVMREAIRKAVMELPLKLRGAVVLFYMEDMGIGDIARTLQISEGTVKSRLHNAKKKLRERLALYE